MYFPWRMGQDRTRFIPSRLREARADLSLEALAAAAGVTRQTIMNWESGRGEPDASDLAAIAALTGRPLDFFFEPTTEEDYAHG